MLARRRKKTIIWKTGPKAQLETNESRSTHKPSHRGNMDCENPALQMILKKLTGPFRMSPGQWQACCPAHQDDSPSLSVGVGDGGCILLHCHAGCTTEQVLGALNLETGDLFPSSDDRRREERTRVYDYCGADGELLYQVVRVPPKKFRQRRPVGRGRWEYNLRGVVPVLYRLPEILSADLNEWIFVVEGEKDADRLHGLGLVATTAPMGAGKWKKVDSTCLHGRRVAVVPDNDEPGSKYALDIVDSLYGKAAELKIISLPDLPHKGDVSDWLNAKGNVKRLLELAEEASPIEERPIWGGTKKVGLILKALNKVQPQTLRWLWPSRIPQSKLTMLVGDPGVGKSFLTMDIAARVTNGRGWPGFRRDKETVKGSVIILSAEDDPADTIRPRLDSIGADVSRVHIVEGVARLGREHVDFFSLREDVQHLAKALEEADDIRLVVIDPISAYMGDTDSHNNAEVRGVLAPLAELASKHQVAIVAVSHLNKSAASHAVYRTIGSLAYTAAPRAVHLVALEPETDRRVFLPVKMNIAKLPPAIAYQINDDGKIEWDLTPLEYTANQLLSERVVAEDEGISAIEEAEEWLKSRLTAGQASAKDMLREGRADGISPMTLRRAKKRLNIVSRRDKFGEEGSWFWSLPD